MTPITNIKEIYAALADGQLIEDDEQHRYAALAVDGDVCFEDDGETVAISDRQWTIVPDSDGWIKYYGHGRPVAGGVEVTIQYAHGLLVKGEALSRNWIHAKGARYKIHEPEKPQRTGWFAADKLGEHLKSGQRIRRQLRLDGNIYDQKGNIAGDAEALHMYKNVVWDDDVNPPLTRKQWLGKSAHTSGFMVRFGHEGVWTFGTMSIWGNRPWPEMQWCIIDDQGDIIEGPYPIQVKGE